MELRSRGLAPRNGAYLAQRPTIVLQKDGRLLVYMVTEVDVLINVPRPGGHARINRLVRLRELATRGA
jgi:hypothetical protein